MKYQMALDQAREIANREKVIMAVFNAPRECETEDTGWQYAPLAGVPVLYPMVNLSNVMVIEPDTDK